MTETIKVTKGQPFALFVPLVILNADGTREVVDADTLANISVSLQCACETLDCAYHTHDRYIVLDLPADLKTQEYAVIINATLSTSRQFALRIKKAFAVVEWDYQSNWRDYIIGDAIVLEDTPLIAGVFNSDEEWERLKDELRLQIAAVEAAKAEWEQKLADIDGLAKEATLGAIGLDVAAAKTAAQAAETTAQGTANKEALLAAILANAGTPTITVPNTTLEQTLAPNTLYVFTERTNDLTLTLGEPLVGKVSEYHCFIVAGATAPTVTYPDGITWNGGNEPTIAADKIYEISILGNVAAFFEVEPATQS